MVVTRKNDEAVSPVIGVILMVAITVILAAVIAAFVFGMSGNISKTKTVAITVQKLDASNITVMNNGGQDASSLTQIDVTTSPNAATQFAVPASGTLVAAGAGGKCSATLLNTGGGTSIPVGSTMRVTGGTNSYSGKTQVVAVGTFNDGSNQVLLDTSV